MVRPRTLTGVAKYIFSIVAVAYSYFFIHIAFFGPPVEEVFRGTFFLGVAVMALLLFKNRKRSIRERAVWLDELFAVANLGMLCAAIAIWLHWQLGDHNAKWFRYFDNEVLLVAASVPLSARAYTFSKDCARGAAAVSRSRTSSMAFAS